MRIFYIDESGCTGTLTTGTSPIQPVFILAGFVLHEGQLKRFTRDFLGLKERFFPGLNPSSGEFLDWIKVEIKGADLRQQIRSNSRDERRHALGFMDKLLRLLEDYDARIMGRIYVKGIGQEINGTAIYGAAVQSLAHDFQNILTEEDDLGVMILDTRNKSKDINVSHSVFTQRFKHTGDSYDRLMEMPLFGRSNSHAGIQAADLLCSAFLCPMAVYVFCLGYVNNLHVHMRYHLVRDKFGVRIRHLQYRHKDSQDRWHGGIVTQDAINHQFGSLLFAPARATI